MKEFEAELKRLIVKAVVLEDVEPEDIDSDAPLFIEGLGLDSIDALELSVAIDREYGVRIEGSDDEKRQIFASVHSLAQYIYPKRKSA